MFLLNEKVNYNVVDIQTFTIQNVSIKFYYKLSQKDEEENLQYKMFLLNLIFPKLLE